jgi:hypothetical protein
MDEEGTRQQWFLVSPILLKDHLTKYGAVKLALTQEGTW